VNAPAQAAQAKNWKSRDEYDAFTAMNNEKDPNKKISLAEAFLQKFSNSDFRSGAYLAEMQGYFQLGKSDRAIEAGRKVLESDPDSLDALALLSFVFPFVFNPNPPQWQAGQSYGSPGAVIQAAVAGGAHVQILTKGGMSGASAPPFSATGETVCENGGSGPCWRDGGPLDDYATRQLSRADSDARHGLEVLQKIQKPASVSDEQFAQFMRPKRALFNSAVGFVALQRKDYASAITSLKAAVDDNPTDVYTFYRLGLGYLYSSPSDYDHAIWYIARAVSLAQAAKNPAADDIGEFLKRAYVNYHGNDAGLDGIVTQAAGSANPPDGFKVTRMEAPKHTGNPMVDAFNDMTYPLKFGGETAQKQWDGLKGQDIALGGVIDSVEKGSEAGTYLVRIAILDQSRATPGTYDIAVKDTTQPNVKNLVRGDAVSFKGKADSYTATPNVIVTVVGQITQPDPLPDKPPAKEKPAPTRRRPAHKTTE
jgi:tetratricopeptide (TPR) repeat protein